MTGGIPNQNHRNEEAGKTQSVGKDTSTLNGTPFSTQTLGWQPSCKCGGADLTIINTPIGNGSSLNLTHPANQP